jgi:hypothetical protein
MSYRNGGDDRNASSVTVILICQRHYYSAIVSSKRIQKIKRPNYSNSSLHASRKFVQH